MDLSQFRREYIKGGLSRKDLLVDPVEQFDLWFAQIQDMVTQQEVSMPDPTAVVVATVSAKGVPSQRAVLLKFYDQRGFVFYTNYGSKKAQEIAVNPWVSLLFVWFELERQVRISGRAEKVSAVESAKYIMSRPKESQMAAWISSQSKPLSSRQALLQKLNEMKRKIGAGEVPIPDFWGGFRVVPEEFEFWQGRENRMHDRFLYERENSVWSSPKRLFP